MNRWHLQLDRAEKGKSPLVILLHGLLGHRWIMRSIERRLASENLETINWSYPSTRLPIRHHAELLAELMNEIEQRDINNYHVVAHSMGCIITRQAIQIATVDKLERLVMLTPPNLGSPMATRLSPWLGRVMLPLVELADKQDSFVNRLSHELPSHCQLGIIAAEGDLVVPMASARGRFQCETVSVPGMHSAVLWKKASLDYIVQFLKSGHFGVSSEQPCRIQTQH